ncbi:MAG: hypothetical protein QME64_08765 [bacterium]|nr:hypothetical protein [bacterium]
MIIDTHPELVQAWNKIIARGVRPAIVQQLCRPVPACAGITELEAMHLAQTN